ncbi:bifunctional DNA primase/polymerase [Phytoactinopolyspora limicola]|uniref:bifunctional DNA primase/polymerase n=1 Tax=Phytoactinopolyspora limicola TaxID=2715536 RepID=UPI0014098A12|nr:bifunctional DNA primase/polymerase [Phytoactinopolyspora limicola]
MMLDAALRCASSGLPVFPCVPGTKRPLIQRGFYAAMTDVDEIRDWWTRWPEANLAMPTGRHGGRSTFDVVDVDVHAAGNGYPQMTELRNAGLLDGWTHMVRTPSGGVHIYFPGTAQRNGSVPRAHIDFRSTGGYVLLPPSAISGHGTYVTVASSTQPSASVNWEAIREYLSASVPRRHLAATRAAPDLDSATSERVVERLARYVAQTPEGNRNDVLYWASCRAAEGGVRDTQPLLDAAVRAGLDQREAAQTISSAYRRLAGHGPSQLRRASGRGQYPQR